MSCGRDNLMALYATKTWEGKRGGKTVYWQTSSDQQQIILDKDSPQTATITLKANFNSFCSEFTSQKQLRWQSEGFFGFFFKKCSREPSHSNSPQTVQSSLKWMETQANLLQHCGHCDKLKLLHVGRGARLLCTFVLTPVTYFINHVV